MIDSPVIFLTAAEASGDAHGAGLVAALKTRLPGARLIGAGGAKMAAAGCDVLLDMTAQASMLHGPLFKLRYFHRCLKQLKRHMADLKPDVVVPIDSPALNWHVAKAAHRLGAPVMYYVAPQVWAWARWRLKKLRRLTDRVACILPFEEAYLQQRGVKARFVGHPLFDHLASRPAELPDLTAAAESGKWRVALLPGSRPGEIAAHAPAMVAVARAIKHRWPEATCTFTAPDETAGERIIAATAGQGDVEVLTGRTADVLAGSHFAVAASGTVTLEVAHYGVPAVIVYRVGWWSYNLVGWWLVRTKRISLVNILADREIVPELMPWYGSSRKLARATLEMMDDPARLAQARRDLLEVTALLEDRPQPAADAVADLVIELLDERAG